MNRKKKRQTSWKLNVNRSAAVILTISETCSDLLAPSTTLSRHAEKSVRVSVHKGRINAATIRWFTPSHCRPYSDSEHTSRLALKLNVAFTC